MITFMKTSKKFWDFIILLISLYNAIEIPVRIVFSRKLEGFFLIFDIFVLFALILDIVINIFRKSISKDIEIAKSQFINKSYLKSHYFLVDFVTMLPFDLLIHFSVLPPSLESLALLRLLRIIRLLNLDSVLKQWGVSEFWKPVPTRLAYFIFWIGVLAHWVACGWIYVGFSLEDASNTRIYLRSLYWSVTTLTTIGYGDITASTDIQTIFSICIEILGAGFYGYVIGNLASLLANRDISKANYLEKMERVNSFMGFKKVPGDLQDKIREYYTYLWESKRGYDESQVMDDLPSSLKMKVALYLNQDIFKKIPLFQDASQDLITKLVTTLRPVVFTPGDFIFRKGDIGHNLYFINQGSVEVVSDDEKTVYATLIEGNFFGEIAILQDSVRTASIRAIDFCDMYTLDKGTFENVLLDYPDFGAKIRAMAKERLENPK